MGDSSFNSGAGFSSSNFGMHNAGLHQIGSSSSMINNRVMGNIAGVNSMQNMYGGPGQGQPSHSNPGGSTSLSGGLGVPLGVNINDGSFIQTQGKDVSWSLQGGGAPNNFQRPHQPQPPPHHHPSLHQQQQQQQQPLNLGGTGYQLGSNELLVMLRGSMSQQNNIGHSQGSQEQMNFDLNEFPSLNSGMSSLSVEDGLQNASQPNIFQTLSTSLNAEQGFAIQNEDFPALPGSAVGGHLQEQAPIQQQESRYGLISNNQPPQPQTLQRHPSSSNVSPNLSNSSSGNLSKGNDRSSAPSQQQPPVSANQFGLMGLLGVIRMTDPDLNTLALGSDLTTLGLNLNSSECLYSTFASPWAESPCTREPQFNLPVCYYMQPPGFKTAHFQKFHLESLFYIFYAMPQDVLQAYSAQELYNQEWRYHSELKLWFKRASPSDGIVLPPGVHYIYFDINAWERRGFVGQPGNIAAGFLSEEDVRVKFSGPP